MSYVFLGIWLVICVLLWIAGSPSLSAENEDIGEADDSGIESTNPTA